MNTQYTHLIKKLKEEYGELSIPFLMRKLRVNYEFAKKLIQLNKEIT